MADSDVKERLAAAASLLIMGDQGPEKEALIRCAADESKEGYSYQHQRIQKLIGRIP